MSERLLGHDLDGQRVAYWSQVSVWTDRVEHFLEAGQFQMRLDHLEPGLLDSIQASLTAPRQAAA